MKYHVKKLLLWILVLAVCVSACACGNSGDSGKDGARADADSKALTPMTDFPAYSAEYQLVVDEVNVDEAAVESFIGYAAAAFDAYDGEAFCTYVYEELDREQFSAMVSDIAARATEIEQEKDPAAYAKALDLRSFNVNLSGINLNFAGCVTQYTAYQLDVETSAAAYDELKESFAFCIDQYAQLMYGSKLLQA